MRSSRTAAYPRVEAAKTTARSRRAGQPGCRARPPGPGAGRPVGAGRPGGHRQAPGPARTRLGQASAGSAWVTVLSLLPPSAPIFMPLRTSLADVPAWQVATAVVLTLASVYGLFRVGGRLQQRGPAHRRPAARHRSLARRTSGSPVMPGQAFPRCGVTPGSEDDPPRPRARTLEPVTTTASHRARRPILPRRRWSSARPHVIRHARHGAAASTTQTGPRANVIGWPDKVVNAVPPSASGRDQRIGRPGHRGARARCRYRCSPRTAAGAPPRGTARGPDSSTGRDLARVVGRDVP